MSTAVPLSLNSYPLPQLLVRFLCEVRFEPCEVVVNEWDILRLEGAPHAEMISETIFNQLVDVIRHYDENRYDILQPDLA